MKPAAFRYRRSTSIDQCVDLLSKFDGEAKVLAGGQSLVPLMNLRLARPEVLIDINPVSELSFIRSKDGVLELGAMTRHVEVANSSVVLRSCPILAAAGKLIGYPAIRNRGTIGGSIAHADPAAEMPCLAVALDAELDVVSLRGSRTIAAADFFRSHFTSALEPSELLTSIRFRVPTTTEGWGFEEFARKQGDFAVVAIAAGLTVDHGRIVRAAIAIAGAGDRPLRAAAAEAVLTDQAPSRDVISAAVEKIEEIAGEAQRSVGSVDEFRKRLAGVLGRRAVESALADRASKDANNAE